MEFSDPNWRKERLARQTGRMHAELLASGLPVYTLVPESRPAEERFGGLEVFDGTVTAIHLVYPASTPEGPWADVETARWTGLQIGPASLRLALEHHVRRGGDRFSELTWTESSASLSVDGHRIGAQWLRAGRRWWALRGEHSGIEITLIGRDWHPETLAVETVADPMPILRRLPDDRPAYQAVPSAPGAGPLPADLRREPHRALADAVLHNTAAHAAWQADGGPAPQLPTWWSELWRTAVQRQMQLSGQPEVEAAAAVRGMTSQLAGLFHEFEWFRSDAELRRRAITEILFYSTGLGADVSSRTAQDDWHRFTTADVDPDSRAIANERWITAWQSWASSKRQV
ncbi:hypothetical protein [Actinoplanes xinjiangensis]|uniref:Uncharacterized protein n=1 Tax=Actinoplanes xinjiangensis TaxID=512350 RepID=A0A316FJ43_9ACTN|nr:hypothetical protein [Actinoplanes xinjiangensis]PWK48122.1 hypothetical protein BC793_106149 [Actinoplanes xinjiangensis]GIF39125.1 hypothetical protein Axi01nite_34360 [Actinoplanes xinjiangensis]